jgi:hypothetical protein
MNGFRLARSILELMMIDAHIKLFLSCHNALRQEDICLLLLKACRGHRTTHRTVGLEVGSIFLPASLIAVSKHQAAWSKHHTDRFLQTVLNVPGFQSATGGTLFGAYLGITIPLIGIVVLLCFARPQLKQWYSTTWPLARSRRSSLSKPGAP